MARLISNSRRWATLDTKKFHAEMEIKLIIIAAEKGSSRLNSPVPFHEGDLLVKSHLYQDGNGKLSDGENQNCENEAATTILYGTMKRMKRLTTVSLKTVLNISSSVTSAGGETAPGGSSTPLRMRSM